MDSTTLPHKEKGPDPTWFFSLNDLDLLESEFYEVTSASSTVDQELTRIEEKILHDQETEEEHAQEALEALLEDLPLGSPCSLHANDVAHASIKHLLTSPLAENSLALRAWSFLRPLSLWAKEQETHVSIHEHLFRLRLHAPLIPAKVIFATYEEDHQDEASFVIAENELAMAQRYLQEVLGSVVALGQAELLSQAEAQCIEAEGRQLQELLHGRLRHVRAGRLFRRPR